MKQKKRLEISRFDNENKTDSICFDKFYNYLPTNNLKSMVGIKNAEFPYSYESDETYNLTMPTGVTKFEGISTFKQHFPNRDNDVYRLLVYGDDKKLYANNAKSQS